MAEKVLEKLIKKLVNLYYRRTHFYAWTWGIDEMNGISILSEEVHENFTRYGTKEIPHADRGGSDG